MRGQKYNSFFQQILKPFFDVLGRIIRDYDWDNIFRKNNIILCFNIRSKKAPNIPWKFRWIFCCSLYYFHIFHAKLFILHPGMISDPEKPCVLTPIEPDEIGPTPGWSYEKQRSNKDTRTCSAHSWKERPLQYSEFHVQKTLLKVWMQTTSFSRKGVQGFKHFWRGINVICKNNYDFGFS